MTDVYKYNPDSDLWTKLPCSGLSKCGMVALNGKFTLITGEKISIWNSEAQQWTHSCSPIPTGRADPCSVACYKNYVVVAGGLLGEINTVNHIHRNS